MEVALPYGLRYGYRELLDLVREHGADVAPRGEPCREITDMTIVVPHVADARVDMLCTGVGRHLNVKLAKLEAIQLMAADVNVDRLRSVAPKFGDVMVDGDNLFHGAYGPRVISQFETVRQLITDDPDTRQAVVSIWDKADLTHQGDKPCTLTLQFMLRDNKLNLSVYMRSNDLWLGVPYDMFMFTELQYTLARSLGVVAGSYTHTATSFHLYERDFAASEKVFVPRNQINSRQRGIMRAGKQPWAVYEDVAARILDEEVLTPEETRDNEFYSP